MTEEIRSYSLKYPLNEKGIWLDLCHRHLAVRLAAGASVLDKRRPVSVTKCADCSPRESLR
jgi:hypothetical protein